MGSYSDQGVLIVIEGTDGSGKATQQEQLVKRLTAEGYDVATVDFPQYAQASSYFVRQYLAGAYGSPDQVGPYSGSLFYALDRYEAAPKIREALARGKVVVANRYVGSNMGHQGTKFLHAEERRGYFIWLDNLEFEMLRVPRPKLSVVLRVPAETASQLIEARGLPGPRDIHEGDLEHLKKAVEVYDDMCQLFPKDFQRIDCTRDGQLLGVDTIHDIIWQKVEPLLPPKPTAPGAVEALSVSEPAPSVVAQSVPSEETMRPITALPRPDGEFYIPDALVGDLRGLYSDSMSRILALRSEIAVLLVDHADPERELALRALLPIAATNTLPPQSGPSAGLKHVIHQLTNGLLPVHYAERASAVRLVSASPRNEFDMLPDIVFAASDLPLAALREACSEWPYEVKLKLLEAYLKSLDDQGPALQGALQKLRYTWDLTCDYASLLDIQAAAGAATLELQALTPRYGYDVPKAIEEADVIEQFEACFALSLQLYSSLQEAGHQHEAQYATLLGHKARGKLDHSGGDALRLFQAAGGRPTSANSVLRLMHEKLSEIHPSFGEFVPKPHATS